MLVGLLFLGSFSDRVLHGRIRVKQEPKPEDRLPLYIIRPSVVTVPVDLLIYRWLTDNIIYMKLSL